MKHVLDYKKYPEFSRTWCLIKTIEEEGGALFTNDPKDSGGATKFGITQRFATENGYEGSVENLTLDEAVELGKKGVWDKMKLDLIHEISPAVAYMLYDAGYNCGWKRAGRWFQEWLTVNNNEGTYYPDIKPDGWVGNKTKAAYVAYINKRGSERAIQNLVWSFLGQQLTHYKTCALNNPKNERFVWGWTNRVDNTFQLICDETIIYLKN